ncbi:hypothetical protein [Amaricoccus solimangrovi]|uniref:Uncharacterized protein n=1 Tax=Amaricoccus solimangrovi TaxID=2589815 RepID=A0A501WHM7_9RHOB|nr:hypothetical protein [Amaricoccus solimangrovi]TPE48292.1 hypothetical protein FJM51_18055 [Amaricoccus solimangrovi]
MIEAKTRESVEPDGWAREARRAGGARPCETPRDERERASAYLDLWERHVSGKAIRGRGIAAPWFSR